jgi:signal transduction histidine kinase
MDQSPAIDPEHIELLKKIEQLELEKQQLIGLVSHDLRSPLNRAFALAELLLLEKDTLTDFQKDYLEKMRLVIADGLAMMRNLVDYRNLEFRSIDIMSVDININEFIDKLVREFQSIADKKEIAINISHQGSGIIKSDKQCLDRVLGNLISNALKFSKAGKKVNIRSVILPDHSVQIEIEDEIGGFTPEEYTNLFKKFQRFKAQPTGNESSTGLGLFVAKSMAERIRGEVLCTTTAGTGSVFTVLLPGMFDQSNK